MKLSFSETMRGTVGDRPIEFTVTARAEGLGFFTLDGTAKAQPWAEGRATGSLHLSLRALSYRLHLPNGYVLTAKKTPSLLHPLRSMTWMPAKLTDSAGNTVAEGEMTFALRELPAFLFSALPARGDRGRPVVSSPAEDSGHTNPARGDRGRPVVSSPAEESGPGNPARGDRGRPVVSSPAEESGHTNPVPR